MCDVTRRIETRNDVQKRIQRGHYGRILPAIFIKGRSSPLMCFYTLQLNVPCKRREDNQTVIYLLVSWGQDPIAPSAVPLWLPEGEGISCVGFLLKH
ncbi:hypothetical protein XENTR_v10003168 [Xenopus tropicalis]|nr:hypothetical protein XENTR_v10003168 [Xenopus tropicalis]